jgi:hypothetical protein
MNLLQVSSIVACVMGFLMPIISYPLFKALGYTAPLTDFIRNGINYWLALSVLFWSISILLWGDRSRYWVMWTLIGTIGSFYLLGYMFLRLMQ